MRNSDFELGFTGRCLAVLCFILAAIIAVGGLKLDHEFVSYMRPDDLEGAYVLGSFNLILMMPFYVAVWKLVRLGQRLRSPKVASLLQRDPRPPVLYLRSYAEEDQKDSRTGRRLEELITPTLRILGPVIAIGKPGEILPRLGAARLAVEPAQWKIEVHRLMELSQLIVFRAGYTEGVLWELGDASKLTATKPILICAPVPHADDITYKTQQYERFRRALANSFPAAAAPLPAEPANTEYFLIDKPGHVTEFAVMESLRRPTILEKLLSNFGVGKSLPAGILETLRPGLGAKAERSLAKRKALVYTGIVVMYGVLCAYLYGNFGT